MATSTKARELIVNFSQSVLGQAVKEAACPDEAGEKMPVLVPDVRFVWARCSLVPAASARLLIARNRRTFRSSTCGQQIGMQTRAVRTNRTFSSTVLKRFRSVRTFASFDIDGLPIVDGFLYGFPCNDFSLVGESKGLDGNYGGLYSYGVKYINRANPLFFFAENVSGLSSANDGKAFKVILDALNTRAGSATTSRRTSTSLKSTASLRLAIVTS